MEYLINVCTLAADSRSNAVELRQLPDREKERLGRERFIVVCHTSAAAAALAEANYGKLVQHKHQAIHRIPLNC